MKLNDEQLRFFYNEVLGEIGWCDEDEEAGTDPLAHVLGEIRKMRKEIEKANAKLEERNTVHEWLNSKGTPKIELGKPICLLRRLAIALEISEPFQGESIMHEPCSCTEWKRSEPQLEEMVLIAEEGGFLYTGKRFDYCPWCGVKLTLLTTNYAAPIEAPDDTSGAFDDSIIGSLP